MFGKLAMACVVVCSIGLAGCDSCSSSSQTSTSPSPSASVGDASAASLDGSASASDDTAASGLVSLINATDARIAVSSTVDNPRDFPEHLIDNKKDTAWNGKTGDLVGGFIAIRIPKDARVDRIRITCGFDHVAKDGKDLFTANHRIKRLEVKRDGALVKEVALDINRRDLQSIPIDGPGGDYVLTVLETVPGTMTAWKELVVSELQVLGDPKSARLESPRTVRVRVGSLDAPEWTKPPPPVDKGPRTSLDAYCKWFTKKHEQAVRDQFTSPNFPCNDPNAHAECEAKEENPSDAGTPPLRVMRVWESSEDTSSTTYAVVAQNGAFEFVGGETADRCALGDPDQQSYKVLLVEPKTLSSGAAAVAVLGESITHSPMYNDPETGEPTMWLRVIAERSVTVCKIAGERTVCDKPVKIGSFMSQFRGSGDAEEFTAWPDARGYEVLSDGKLRLFPVKPSK